EEAGAYRAYMIGRLAATYPTRVVYARRGRLWCAWVYRPGKPTMAHSAAEHKRESDARDAANALALKLAGEDFDRSGGTLTISSDDDGDRPTGGALFPEVITWSDEQLISGIEVANTQPAALNWTPAIFDAFLDECSAELVSRLESRGVKLAA